MPLQEAKEYLENLRLQTKNKVKNQIEGFNGTKIEFDIKDINVLILWIEQLKKDG